MLYEVITHGRFERRRRQHLSLSRTAAKPPADGADVAHRLVCEWGMSSLLGPMVYRRTEHQFLGEVDVKTHFSETTAREIDLEVRRIIGDCYDETERLLRNHNRRITSYNVCYTKLLRGA